jgi:hypothetical protein
MLTNGKPPAGTTAESLGNRSAGERINTRGIGSQAATQAQRLAAISVCSGTTCIGYVIELDGTAIALDANGITLGQYRDTRTAFRALNVSYLGESRP